jgi:pimeloyl-ACP methyl ester carboxylesterase
MNNLTPYEPDPAADWNEVRKILRQPKARSFEATVKEEKLRQYFGEMQFEKMRSASLRGEQTKAELGNIVLLPGIMGSQLTVGGDRVWLNYWRIALGDLTRLKLDEDGKNTIGGEDVKALNLIGSYYGYALEYLQAEPFAYDWRLDLDEASNKLADFMKENYSGKKVRFVAHSMGGLVVRNFIRLHKKLWDDIDGSLIMLGTPNRGAIAATQALIGKNSTQSALSWLDIPHRRTRIVEIIDSFPGVYQLMPMAQTNIEWLFDVASWQGFPVSAKHLKRAREFQAILNSAPETIDAARMFYIAGVGSETPLGLTRNNGNYDYTFTMKGDGTVPHETGLLTGVPTYYVEEAHADLPNNELVLQATKEILLTGKAVSLTSVPPPMPRTISTNSERKFIENKVVNEIESIGQSIREGNFNEDAAVWAAERKLIGVLLGGKIEATPQKSVEEKVAETFTPYKTTRKDPTKVSVELVLGDIITANAPIIAVGQYQNVPPTGAAAAIDETIDYLITLAQQSGMIGAQLGQLFIIPVKQKKDKLLNKNVESVFLGGMGRYGEFSREDLRYLMMNIISAVLALGLERFATVMIGTSLDTFSIERAVRSLIFAICDGMERQINGKPIKNLSLVLVENQAARYKQIEAALLEVKEIINEDRKKEVPKLPFGNIELEIKNIVAEKVKKSKRGKKPFFVLPEENRRNITRVTVDRFLETFDGQGNKRTEGFFRLSVLTSRATIPIREITVQDFLIDELTEKIRRAYDPKTQEDYGKLLHSILIPEDFQSLIDSNKQIVLTLNREAARIPWEMISFGDSRGISNFGRDLNLSRQFSSLLVNVPSVSPPLNNTFKALIIADPAPDLHLPGAEAEGLKLREVFTRMKETLKEKDIDLQFQTRIGPAECDLVKILSLIFNEDFDLIHFAGHGSFDAEQPSNSGWVFGKNRILSANEIFRLPRVPRLVFANACFSGELPTTESNSKLAGLAEAFFRKGIENCIGTGWEVNDLHAQIFAEEFYLQVLEKGEMLGTALSESRSKICAGANGVVIRSDSTWGAYHHYGDANTKLVKG